MAKGGRSKAIIETSVLVNFLKIDRTDLLAMHPDYQFVVVDLVKDEVTNRYAMQLTRLQAAISATHLLPDDPPETISLTELEVFAKLATFRIGNGERAAIAAAHARSLPLAIDDEKAWKRAGAFCTNIPRETTVSLMVTLVRAGVIDLSEADSIKADWEANHKFTLRFATFGERV